MKELEFDTVIHLAGEQIVPNYMALKLSEANHHILLTTNRTKKQIDTLKHVFSGKDYDFLRHVEVHPTNYDDVCAKLKAIEGLENRRVAVNVTGGTKPMSVAALDFCREKGFTPFYIDTQTRKVSFFGKQYLQLDMPRVFDSVEEFFKLNGFAVLSQGKMTSDLSDARISLIDSFWKAKDEVRRYISGFSEAADDKYQNRKDNPPDCYRQAIEGLYKIRGKKGQEIVSAWEEVFPARGSDWRNAARFAAGEWFELWMLLQFGKSRKNEEFRDLRSGVKLSFLNAQNQREAQEIDMTYTDGYTLTIIECKAGRVYQEHIQKLENITRQIGGAMGRGILCAINYQYEDDVVVQRVKNGNIALVTGDKPLRMLPNRYLEIKPKKCYQAESDY